MPTSWQNKIVGYGEEAPDQLLAHPRNPKIHPKRQQQALDRAISDIGWLTGVIVNQRTGHVIDGHARVELAISRGEPTVPVAYVDLDEVAELKALATFDPIGSLAVTDQQKTDDLLKDLALADVDFAEMVRDLSKDDEFVPGGVNDPDAEWQGMPEFTQDDLTAFKSLIVNFASFEDMEAFSRLIEQKVTDRTRSIWYPPAEIGHYADKRYEDES